MEKKIFLESEKGFFGEGDNSFGGCFVPEILYAPLHDLQKAYKQIFQTKSFRKELKRLFKTFAGRPTPLIYAKNASEILCNDIYIKFDGLANTGSHKINNALAQVLLAKKMNKKHIIAETGAGQHGIAVASACAFLKMPCTIFIGEADRQRHLPNVFIMQQFGAEVVSVESGTKVLKDSINEALKQWSSSPNEYFYVIGSAVGPYPYPDIVREAQSIVGYEIKKQIIKALSKNMDIILPNYIIASVGGGSNAIGAFSAFLNNMEVKLLGIEAGGENFLPNKNAMCLSENSGARIGIAQGFKSYFLQDQHGQIQNTHSIGAGLDYAGVGPQLAHLANINRAEFLAVSDDQALEAMQFFARHEGILASLESSHALAGVIQITKEQRGKIIVVNVSGRGDKDIFITAKKINPNEWRDFLSLELQSTEKQLKQQETAQEEEVIQEETGKNMEELKQTLQSLSHKDLEFLDLRQSDTNISTGTTNNSTTLSNNSINSKDSQPLDKQPSETDLDHDNTQNTDNILDFLYADTDNTQSTQDSTESADTQEVINNELDSELDLSNTLDSINSKDSQPLDKQPSETDSNHDNTQNTDNILDFLYADTDNTQSTQDSTESADTQEATESHKTSDLNTNGVDNLTKGDEYQGFSPLEFLNDEDNKAIDLDLKHNSISDKHMQDSAESNIGKGKTLFGELQTELNKLNIDIDSLHDIEDIKKLDASEHAIKDTQDTSLDFLQDISKNLDNADSTETTDSIKLANEEGKEPKPIDDDLFSLESLFDEALDDEKLSQDTNNLSLDNQTNYEQDIEEHSNNEENIMQDSDKLLPTLDDSLELQEAYPDGMDISDSSNYTSEFDSLLGIESKDSNMDYLIDAQSSSQNDNSDINLASDLDMQIQDVDGYESFGISDNYGLSDALESKGNIKDGVSEQAQFRVFETTPEFSKIVGKSLKS